MSQKGDLSMIVKEKKMRRLIVEKPSDHVLPDIDFVHDTGPASQVRQVKHIQSPVMHDLPIRRRPAVCPSYSLD